MNSTIYEIEYETFKQHTDYLIVNALATVTPVAGADPTIEDANIIIDNACICDDDLDIYQSLCSAQSLDFGACESDHIKVTINDANVPNTTDEYLTVYKYSNGDSSNIRVIGTYRVTKDKYNADKTERTIEMYDDIREINTLDITDWYNNFFADGQVFHTVEDMRNSFFTYLTSLGLLVTQDTIELVNDNMVIYQSILNNVKASKILHDICQINGVFGHIDRNNVFKYVSLKPFTSTHDFILHSSERLEPTTYDEFEVSSINRVNLYDENNNLIASEGGSGKNIYSVTNNSLLAGKRSSAELDAVAQNLYHAISYLKYTPCSVKCLANIGSEVGDFFKVEGKFTSYLLSRSIKGTQVCFDTITAKGQKKLPALNTRVTNNTSRNADEFADGEMTDGKIVELLRNIGYRLLDEPSDVSIEYDFENEQALIKWRDPVDIEDNKPVTATWDGTLVVRCENYPPLHRWSENTVVVADNTERDHYSSLALVDDDVEGDKIYYYGLFPYENKGDVKYYRWTKVLKLSTKVELEAPRITYTVVSGTSVEVNYSLPSGRYSTRKLVYKANVVPKDETDGTAVSLGTGSGTGSKLLSGLSPRTMYYFVIFDTDPKNRKANSEPVSALTTEEEDTPRITAVTAIDATTARIDYVNRVGNHGGTIECILHESGTVTRREFIGAAGTSETISGLQFGGLYDFKISQYMDSEWETDPFTDTYENVQLPDTGGNVYEFGWSYNDWTRDSKSGMSLATITATKQQDNREYWYVSASATEAMLDYYINSTYSSFDATGNVVIDFDEIRLNGLSGHSPYVKWVFRDSTGNANIKSIKLGKLGSGESIIESIPDLTINDDAYAALCDNQRHNVKLYIPADHGYIKGTIVLTVDDVAVQGWTVDTNISGIAPINARFTTPNRFETMYIKDCAIWGFHVVQVGTIPQPPTPPVPTNVQLYKLGHTESGWKDDDISGLMSEDRVFDQYNSAWKITSEGALTANPDGPSRDYGLFSFKPRTGTSKYIYLPDSKSGELTISIGFRKNGESAPTLQPMSANIILDGRGGVGPVRDGVLMSLTFPDPTMSLSFAEPFMRFRYQTSAGPKADTSGNAWLGRLTSMIIPDDTEWHDYKLVLPVVDGGITGTATLYRDNAQIQTWSIPKSSYNEDIYVTNPMGKFNNISDSYKHYPNYITINRGYELKYVDASFFGL